MTAGLLCLLVASWLAMLAAHSWAAFECRLPWLLLSPPNSKLHGTDRLTPCRVRAVTTPEGSLVLVELCEEVCAHVCNSESAVLPPPKTCLSYFEGLSKPVAACMSFILRTSLLFSVDREV